MKTNIGPTSEGPGRVRDRVLPGTAALFLVLVLAGCALAERRAYYGAECRKAGDRLQTPEYDRCVESYLQRDTKAANVF